MTTAIEADPKQQAYLESLIDFVNKLPMTKKQKISFITQLVETKEESFVSNKDKLETKENMPMFYNSETGEKRYADDKVLFQSVGDEDIPAPLTLCRETTSMPTLHEIE